MTGRFAVAAEEPRAKSGLGLVMYCVRHQRDRLRSASPPRDLFEPLPLLHHCREIGAGGAQLQLGVLDSKAAATVRKFAEQHVLYIEAIVSPPKRENDVERFDAQMKSAAEAGSIAARTVLIPGRRYEYFDSLDVFQEHADQARRSLELAAPIAEKYRVPLAAENHKDQRDGERIALLEHIGSEYVGACVDTGNSVALLEDPVETVRRFAPWAKSVHLKDQALKLYKDGFLLGDTPLGRGSLDLKQMVDILRKEKPNIRFTLELITRDPLKVPCLTERYWATFPDLPARELARTLRFVRQRQRDQLMYVSQLDAAQRAQREAENVRASLDFARDALRI